MAVQVIQRNAAYIVDPWARALARAINEALDVLIEPISGEAFVESATRPGVLYAVSATSCSCPAGQRGVACKHHACYLAQIGELPLDPEPPAARFSLARQGDAPMSSKRPGVRIDATIVRCWPPNRPDAEPICEHLVFNLDPEDSTSFVGLFCFTVPDVFKFIEKTPKLLAAERAMLALERELRTILTMPDDLAFGECLERIHHDG